MIKNIYTYIRILLSLLPFVLLFYKGAAVYYAFFFAVITFSFSIPARRLIKEGTLTEFEVKLNYFMDEFFVYGAVIFLSTIDLAPFWVVLIYFFKDATIGAVRNFAMKQDVKLNERFGYKLDKVVQYCLIILAAFAPFFSFTDTFFSIKRLFILFYMSAAVSALSLIVFFFMNKEFMKKIHSS